MAKVMPVQLYRGDTWTRAWTPKDPNGVPIDLTGASARLALRDKAGVQVIEATAENGRLTIVPSPGQINLVVAYVDMELPAGTYRFALKVTYANGRRKTYELNTLVVLEDV